MIGFLVTAVLLPVLGVIVVARFDGLDKLAGHVGKRFSLVFTLLIYLSIGPGLGIPRAASVPFEMAVAPYLPESANVRLFLLLYSLVFFLAALWLCLNPGKLVKRIGNFLTPSLLLLLLFLFVSFLFRGERAFAAPQRAYASAPLLRGFAEGYQTMDTIAALNFGLVIATTLTNFGLSEKRTSCAIRSGRDCWPEASWRWYTWPWAIWECVPPGSIRSRKTAPGPSGASSISCSVRPAPCCWRPSSPWPA